VYVQMVTFGLNGVTEEQFHDFCAGEAATFGALPGLLGKIWLRQPEENTYGAVYLWRDRAAHDDYVQTEVWRSVTRDPNLADVQSRGFEVFEDLTKETQPGLALV
jgi:heme-degrading monooxygenase HmoA